MHLRIDITDLQCTLKTPVILAYTMKMYTKLMRCNISIVMVPKCVFRCIRAATGDKISSVFLLHSFSTLFVQFLFKFSFQKVKAGLLNLIGLNFFRHVHYVSSDHRSCYLCSVGFYSHSIIDVRQARLMGSVGWHGSFDATDC